MKEKGIMIKDFRKKVAEAKDNITDKDFFLSESCGIYLQNLATAITKEYWLVCCKLTLGSRITENQIPVPAGDSQCRPNLPRPAV